MNATWHLIQAVGYKYYASYLVNGAPVGWISQLGFWHPYQAFFCDGKTRVQHTFGLLPHAEAWIAALAVPPAVAVPVAPAAPAEEAK